MRHYSNNTGIMQQVADNATKQALAGASKVDCNENRGACLLTSSGDDGSRPGA